MGWTWRRVPLAHGVLSTAVAACVAPWCVPKGQVSEGFVVRLADGSVLTGEIDEPESGPAVAHVLLVHGLGSSAHDPGVRRLALVLAKHGFMVYRMNHRNAGSGQGLAGGIYHGGRSDDILQVLEDLARRNFGAPWLCMGLSLSGRWCSRWRGCPDMRRALRTVPSWAL